VTDRRFLTDDRRRHIHSIFAAGRFQEMRRRFMPESARTEMHADPDPVLFIRKNIDVMIPAANSPELLGGHRFQITHRFQVPCRIFE